MGRAGDRDLSWGAAAERAVVPAADYRAAELWDREDEFVYGGAECEWGGHVAGVGVCERLDEGAVAVYC